MRERTRLLAIFKFLQMCIELLSFGEEMFSDVQIIFAFNYSVVTWVFLAVAMIVFVNLETILNAWFKATFTICFQTKLHKLVSIRPMAVAITVKGKENFLTTCRCFTVHQVTFLSVYHLQDFRILY